MIPNNQELISYLKSSNNFLELVEFSRNQGIYHFCFLSGYYCIDVSLLGNIDIWRSETPVSNYSVEDFLSSDFNGEEATKLKEIIIFNIDLFQLKKG